MSLIPTTAVPSITVGGRVFTDLANLITLGFYYNTNAGSTGRLASASSGYQIPAGKSFKAMAFKGLINVAGTSGVALSYYSQTDNDVGMDSATVFTNPVNAFAQSGLSCMFGANGPVGSVVEGPLPDFLVATGKYMSTQRSGAAAEYAVIYVYGYLV